MPTISRPDSAIGHPWAWIGVGEVNPAYRSSSIISAGKPDSSKVKIGSGISWPFVVISFDRRHSDISRSERRYDALERYGSRTIGSSFNCDHWTGRRVCNLPISYRLPTIPPRPRGLLLRLRRLPGGGILYLPLRLILSRCKCCWSMGWY
uniref:Uncharacterized protein n=1 Tax=Anopheles christyi TaxID=43041 RepID=A0A182KIB9_9DIPT